MIYHHRKFPQPTPYQYWGWAYHFEKRLKLYGPDTKLQVKEMDESDPLPDEEEAVLDDRRVIAMWEFVLENNL
jgi:hypothetical protein